MLEFSLVILRREDEFLLARKSRSIGAGCWNGYGGKKEPGETNLECAKRELFEESSIKCEELIDAGFFEVSGYKTNEEMRINLFVGEHWEGQPQESAEMSSPTWFKGSEIPYDNMLPSAQCWFPFVCKRQQIAAKFLFGGPDHNEIRGIRIDVIGLY